MEFSKNPQCEGYRALRFQGGWRLNFMYRCVVNVILDADSKLFFIFQFKNIPTLPADHPRCKACSKLNNIEMAFERGDLSVEKMAIALGHRCNQCFTVCGFPPQLEHLGSMVVSR